MGCLFFNQLAKFIFAPLKKTKHKRPHFFRFLWAQIIPPLPQGIYPSASGYGTNTPTSFGANISEEHICDGF